MCRIFIGADPALYRAQTRSLRLHRVSTSIRLEAMFWQVLEEIGARDGMTVNQLIAKLYDELAETGADLSNFASFLRVCCTRYLALTASGHIPADLSVPIRDLDADFVLAGERTRVRSGRRGSLPGRAA